MSKNQIRKTISGFHVSKCSNILTLYTLNVILSKIGSIFFFFFTSCDIL